MTIVITPLQIKLLGMEAYGLVSFINTMQIVFVAFELGLASTLTRELAADTTPDKSQCRALVGTASAIYWLCALTVGGLLLVLAEPIAARWFRSQSLDLNTMSTAVGVIAIYLAIRWPIGLYTGILTGLQRMDVLNGIKATMTTIRLLGGILILIQWSDLTVFLLWTALASVLEVSAYIIFCRRVYPNMPMGGTISIPALKHVWRFSISMSLLGLLAVVIVQMDRLFVSKMLSLEDLGHYNLAYTVSSIIAFLIGVFGSAVLPYFASVSHPDMKQELKHRYRLADKLVISTASLVSFAFLFHGVNIVSWWISPEAASDAKWPLLLLTAGFWVSALINNVYSLAIAAGSPGYYLKINAFIILPYAMLVYVTTTNWGIAGAAFAWLILNLTYAALIVPVIHRNILSLSTKRWLLNSVIPFVVIGLIVFGLPKLAMQAVSYESNSISHAIVLMFSILLYVIVVWRLFASSFGNLPSLANFFSQRNDNS